MEKCLHLKDYDAPMGWQAGTHGCFRRGEKILAKFIVWRNFEHWWEFNGGGKFSHITILTGEEFLVHGKEKE